MASRAGGAAQQLVDGLIALGDSLGLAALLVQPPDFDEVLDMHLAAAGFVQEGLFGVIDSTLLIDLTPGFDFVRSGMGDSMRRKVRQGEKAGLRLREGGFEDLPTFFELMQVSCKRQNTVPNPPSLKSVQDLWTAFDGRSHLRLTFATRGSEDLATILALNYGNRSTLWKKGWSERAGNLRPNEYITHESIEWACKNGYELYDFVGFQRSLAEQYQINSTWPPEIQQTRHWFFAQFGGKPACLPRSRIYIMNSVLRGLFARISAFPLGRPLLKRLVGR